MSDHGNILYYLEESRRSLEDRDYLNAAVNAYWCVKYCEQGDPYGISDAKLSDAEGEARRTLRSCVKKFKSCRLSKTSFVYGTICPKMLWLYRNRYDLRHVSPATQRKFDAGHAAGALAQRLFPDGIDASDVDSERIIDMSRFSLPINIRQQLWLDKTAQHYLDRTVYEAAFVHNDVFAAVDILTRGAEGHIAYEVKCSRSVTDTFLKDCALQYYVISHNCRLEDFYLVYVDGDYLDSINVPIDGITETSVDIDRLFIKESVLSRILPMQRRIREEIDACKSVLAKKQEPRVATGAQCTTPYECMYAAYCKGLDRDFSIW